MGRLETILDDFAFLDDWEDRYRYVIELGRDLPAFPDDKRSAETKVNGCASQVWIHAWPQESDGGTTLHFVGDSDAMIVKGLIAILHAIYDGETVQRIGEIEPRTIFDTLGLNEHLTQQRANGLASMVQRVQQEAAQFSKAHGAL